ncbi:methyl-accepting chemotaxis protein [Telmatospirillum sp.]|uniref:methyl-accepting chemotaxis protein n=1 Tax=Telmatospirillum sp. TaxID=2079197 RepID=UPI00284536C5|nr:methyl-accepting chemotaxis protein [Telmatospirillum sp.]MDR3440670.1 methyl-accepting chemotaxis protein [Telmatospirillum sp.]
MFLQGKISVRLLAGFAAMGGLVLLLATLGSYESKIADETVVIMERQNRNGVLTERMAKNIALARGNMAKTLLTKDEAPWQDALAELTLARERQTELKASIVNPQRRAKVEEIEALTADYGTKVQNYRRLRDQVADHADELAAVIRDAAEAGRRIDALNEELTQMIRDSANLSIAAAKKDMATVSRWVAIIGWSSLALACVMGVLLSRGISRPITRLTAIMTQLAEGRMSVAIAGTARQDEIGEMARAVEVFKRHAEENRSLHAQQEQQRSTAEADRRHALLNMADNVENELGGAVADISSLTGEVSEAADQLYHMSLRTRESATAAVSVADESMTSAEAVSAATQELHASIAEITRQIGGAKTMADRAVQSAETSEAVMSGLSEATQRIGSVVDVITDIAAQTNLLALNATIEASRAGDAGKGFAVVAAEVKTLANQTARATTEITAQITNIRDEVMNALATIRGIATTIVEVETATTGIAAAIEQQSAATSEISRAVDLTADAARQVDSLMAALAEQAAQSCELSEDVKKDGSRVTETVAGLSRTVGRVIRTSSKDVCRRKTPRFGVFVGCRAKIGDNSTAAALTSVSIGGVTIFMDGGGQSSSVGQSIDVDCADLGGRKTGKIVGIDNQFLHVAFDATQTIAPDVLGKVADHGALALLNKAKSDHETFVNNVLAVVAGRSKTKAADLANHHTCRLGKWYDNVSDDRIRSQPAFRAIAQPHKQVHDAGKRALAAFWKGDEATTRARAEEMKQASHDVVRLLTQLIGELQQSGGSDRRAA